MKPCDSLSLQDLQDAFACGQRVDLTDGDRRSAWDYQVRRCKRGDNIARYSERHGPADKVPIQEFYAKLAEIAVSRVIGYPVSLTVLPLEKQKHLPDLYFMGRGVFVKSRLTPYPYSHEPGWVCQRTFCHGRQMPMDCDLIAAVAVSLDYQWAVPQYVIRFGDAAKGRLWHPPHRIALRDNKIVLSSVRTREFPEANGLRDFLGPSASDALPDEIPFL